MDSPTTIDPALTDPNTLISSRISTPTEAQKTAPVCVLVHGFSASSFEWQEFLSHANQWDDTVLFSTIVMGGHGRNFDSFKSASYQDWFAPITEEVQRLQSLGYTNISLFGVSTGATGILHLMLNDQIDRRGIRQLILMDPYIVPKDSLINWVHLFGLIIKNSKSSANREIEFKHWYTNRPIEALNELRLLIKRIQSDLTNDVPDMPNIHIFTADRDSVADTASADMIQQALGALVRIHRYHSPHHVIIESQAKESWTDYDREIQLNVFRSIRDLFDH